MQVTIVAAVEEPAGVRVVFTCEVGRATARWTGPTPVPGDGRGVELDIAGALVVGRDLVESSEPIGVSIDDDQTIVIGEVVAADQNGVVVIRLGRGLLTLSVEGPLPRVGQRYRIVTRGLLAHDCDY